MDIGMHNDKKLYTFATKPIKHPPLRVHCQLIVTPAPNRSSHRLMCSSLKAGDATFRSSYFEDGRPAPVHFCRP